MSSSLEYRPRPGWDTNYNPAAFQQNRESMSRIRGRTIGGRGCRPSRSSHKTKRLPGNLGSLFFQGRI